MKKLILRRLELLQNNDWTKEETLENILKLIEDYSKRFIIFADENEHIKVLDELYSKFDEYYSNTTDINGNLRENR